MKIFKFLSILVFLSVSLREINSQMPHPEPLPNLNLEAVLGTWFVAFYFESNLNNSIGSTITCFTFNFEVSGDSVQANKTIYFYQSPINLIANYEVQTPASIWLDVSDSSSDIEWIAIDPFAYSWALIASVNSQYAAILSRSPEVSNILIANLSALLQSEYYEISSYNTQLINNECPDLNTEKTQDISYQV